MNSTNWRTKRQQLDEPTNNEQVSQSLNQFSRTSRGSTSWRQSNNRGERALEGFSPSVGFGAMPAFQDERPLYRGGPNPRRGRHSAPAPRPAVPITRDPMSDQSIDEGRRVYVGNLPYDATVEDIRNLFIDFSTNIQKINMSVDAMTGRNPSYCFLDCATKAVAETIILHFNGLPFLGRPLKVNPGVKSGTGTGRYQIKDTRSPSQRSGPESGDARPYAFDRWRRMNPQKDVEGLIDPAIDVKGMNDSAIEEGRRLHVGGLPRFQNQPNTNHEMVKFFKGFNVQVVSKQLSPPKSAKENPGNNYYCYVDLATKEEAEEAVAALDGIEMWNWDITVQISSRRSGKLNERQRIYINDLPLLNREDDRRKLMNDIRGKLQPYASPKLISNIFTRPKEGAGNGNNRRCYCFVEFATADDADAAIRGLFGSELWGGSITVRGSKHRGVPEPVSVLDEWMEK
jgi:RNA recognition motif-containing protein